MADVFISYKSERRAAARHLSKIMALHGFSAWYDYGLIPGEDFERRLMSELAAAKVCVVLWCKLAVSSEWVLKEATEARRLNTLLPCRIQQTDLPKAFAGADTINLAPWDGSPRSHDLDRLLSDIGRRLGRAPQPDFAGLMTLYEDWRSLGAPPLAQFALGEALQPAAQVPLSPKPTRSPEQIELFWVKFVELCRAAAESGSRRFEDVVIPQFFDAYQDLEHLRKDAGRIVRTGAPDLASLSGLVAGHELRAFDALLHLYVHLPMPGQVSGLFHLAARLGHQLPRWHTASLIQHASVCAVIEAANNPNASYPYFWGQMIGSLNVGVVDAGGLHEIAAANLWAFEGTSFQKGFDEFQGNQNAVRAVAALMATQTEQQHLAALSHSLAPVMRQKLEEARTRLRQRHRKEERR